MGEIILLSEWIKQKKIEEVKLLQENLDQIMTEINVRRRFFLFDYFGNPIEIQQEVVTNERK